MMPLDINGTKNEVKDLIVLNRKKEKVLTFTQLPEFVVPENLQKLDIDEKEISKLNSLIQAAPSLATADNVRKTKYMEVAIDGTLIKAKDGGFRAMSKGANGKIKEHATLFSSDKLSKLANLSAIYNVASVVVAQQHLADISSQLKDIKSSLDSIKNFQNDKRESKIYGAIQYFKQISTSVIKGEHEDAILHQIEAQECELIGIQNHLQKEIDGLIKKNEMKDDDTFGTESLVNSIMSHQDTLYDLTSQLLLCIRARACGWQLLSYYPNREDIISSRYSDIKKSIVELNGGTLIDSCSESIKSHIRKVGSQFNREETLNKRKLKLLDKNECHINFLKTNIKDTEKDLVMADHLYQSRKNEKTSVILRIESGKVVGVSPSLPI